MSRKALRSAIGMSHQPAPLQSLAATPQQPASRKQGGGLLRWPARPDVGETSRQACFQVPSSWRRIGRPELEAGQIPGGQARKASAAREVPSPA